MPVYDKNDFVTCELVAVVDGTTHTFDLLGNDGVYIDTWEPQRPLIKGGGVFQDSPIADGRRFIFGRKGNIVDELVLTYVNDTPEGAVFDDRKLISILELALFQGEHTWSDALVYWKIKTKGANAVDQYAKIEFDELKNGQNPFFSPFSQPRGSSVWEGINLQIEHGAWSPNIPGEGTAVPIGTAMAYNSQDFGNVDSNGDFSPVTDGTAFINEIHTHNNITNVHIGTAGANLLGTAGNYNILSNANPLYIGMSSAIAGFGPFNSVVFNIVTAAAGTFGLTHEYWNGSAWTAFTPFGGGSWSAVGHRALSWSLYATFNWATNSPGGSLPTGYWIRIRVSSGSLSTVPRVSGNPFAVTWPYFEIQSDQIGGDLPALARLLVLPGTQDSEPTTTTTFALGLRSVSRGENFTALLNCSTMNNSNITFGSSGAFSTVTAPFYPTGAAARWTPAAPGETGRITFTLNSTIAAEYTGRFKMFVSFVGTAAIANGDFRARSRISLAQAALGGGVAGGYYASVTNKVRIDLGDIIIPGDPVYAARQRIEINVDLIAGSSLIGDSIDFLDVVLIPVDECAMVTDLRYISYGAFAFGLDIYGDINSVQGEQAVFVSVRNLSSNAIVANMPKAANGPLVFQKSTRQRMWVLTNSDGPLLPSYISRIQAYKHEQYNMFTGKGVAV